MTLTERDRDQIEKVVLILGGCRRVFFITGAGISADSGLPTYRGIGGLYNEAKTDEGIPIESAISGEMMENRPEITWKYLAQMEQACRGATFNRAHEVIAEMQDEFDAVWVLTQNIDGFHRRAGSKNVIDIHGDLRELTCTDCSFTMVVNDYSGLEIPPRCPKCDDILRPDVVLFGEQLPFDKCDLLMKEWENGFDIVFSVGTTSVFPYISQPVFFAKHKGIPTVEINPDETVVTHAVDFKISGRAAESLDSLWQSYQATENRY